MGQDTEHTPVWIMRQAGRYLPEYRKVRSKHSFREVLTTPDLAEEVTLQPLRRFSLDAAIIFSDILIVADAMGMPFEIVPNKGPVMDWSIGSVQDIDRLHVAEPEESLPYLARSIEAVCDSLSGSVPLIGFAGAPFTIACYMIDGGPSKQFSRTRRFLYEHPDEFDRLLSLIAQSIVRLLKMQIDAGAGAIQLFDTWAGLLGPKEYRNHAFKAASQVLASLDGQGVPRILYVGQTGQFLETIREAPAEVLGIDWRTSLSDAIERIGPGYSVQGNLDPCALYLSRKSIPAAVKAVLEQGRKARGHVFNLGHGILPDVDPDHLATLVDSVHQFSG
jgi:uroporphyrinogen decarboxylase